MEKRKKALIVEDEENIAFVLSIRLESIGYEVFTALDGESGWELVKTRLPELLIVDLGLPGMDGCTFCELVKSYPGLKNPKVIILTARHLMNDMENAFSAGADLYVNKPYDWRNLAAHIRQLTGESPLVELPSLQRKGG